MFNWHIANNLSSNGNDVAVVSPLPFFPAIKSLQFMEKWYKFSQVPNYTVYGKIKAYYPKYPMIPKISEAMQSYLMIPFLYRTLKAIQSDNGIDVVNAHYLYPDGVATCRVCKMLNIPVVLSALGSDVNVLGQNKSISGQLKSALEECSAITAVSDDLAKKIQEFGLTDREIHVLHNGVDLSLFSLLNRNNEREKASISVNEKMILYVGRLSPEKGLEYLLKAAIKLKTQWPNLRIVLIGDGPDKHRLRGFSESLDIEDITHFMGEQTPDEINRWLGMSDLLCLPSIREGCPNVILEAFASGRPVVGSNVGGIPEMIEDECNGFLFQPGDVNDLVNKLDVSFRFDWNPASIRECVENRSWTAVSERYIALFKKSIENQNHDICHLV